MATLRELITRAIKEGCATYVDETATEEEITYARRHNEPSKIDTFFANVERELHNSGWEKCNPSAEMSKAYHHLEDAKFFVYKDRFAILSTMKDFLSAYKRGDFLPDTIVCFEILSTIEYEVRKATTGHYGLSIYRWDVTPQKASEALNKCGWVVTKPNVKIASAYANFNGAVFFEKGDMFAVTGLQDVPTHTPSGTYITTEAAIIINYKNKFDD